MARKRLNAPPPNTTPEGVPLRLSRQEVRDLAKLPFEAEGLPPGAPQESFGTYDFTLLDAPVKDGVDDRETRVATFGLALAEGKTVEQAARRAQIPFKQALRLVDTHEVFRQLATSWGTSTQGRKALTEQLLVKLAVENIEEAPNISLAAIKELREEFKGKDAPVVEFKVSSKLNDVIEMEWGKDVRDVTSEGDVTGEREHSGADVANDGGESSVVTEE